MTTDDLRKLALAAKLENEHPSAMFYPAFEALWDACTPERILALLDERDGLRMAFASYKVERDQMQRVIDAAKAIVDNIKTDVCPKSDGPFIATFDAALAALEQTRGKG